MKNVADLESARRSRDEAKQALHSLKGSVEEDTSPFMSEMDAKVAAAEARTDTKFAELMGELRIISTRLDHVERTTSGLRLNIWLAAGTAIALVVSIFGWGTSMFGVGMDADSVARQAAVQASASASQEATAIRQQLDQQGQQINVILQAISRNKPAGSAPESGTMPAPFVNP